jgi:tRNA pseudouridine55 synthase
VSEPAAPDGAAGPTGVVVVDKPRGLTSHDVVDRCRRALGTRRVGHAGTLDPSATGVLVLGVGRATRLLPYVTGHDKVYAGEVVLGTATDTLDDSGTVVARFDMGEVSLAEVQAAAARLTGVVEQVPPMVSAVKVGGRRLHELARRGVTVERRPRRVGVRRFEVRPTAEDGVFRIEVECSAGTYVRVLAADLGRALGGGAHLRALRRLAVGPFRVEEAVPLDALGPEHLLPPLEALRGFPRLVLDQARALALVAGRSVPRAEGDGAGGGPHAALDSAGALVALVVDEGPRWRPRVVVAVPQ